ncbi:711_t:CDS:2 [Funneliformis mosseae]|uniref:711_t:CDS:1 n=1 Tax=Funneliformis mosseae TaxID=27381 RepID=A0A9N9CHI4_FUNMO|nr:711_t:CDS:2 [Funneliformis mosseae]
MTYEFRTINWQGNLINILPEQYVIKIPLDCIYHRMADDFIIPSSSLPNPIFIDLFDV